MIITYQGQENFTIKTKKGANGANNANNASDAKYTLKIGQHIALGELEITTPGEYESGGVQLEVIDGTIEVLSEKMTICWMKKAKVLSDEELEKLGGINILLVGVGGGEFTETKMAIDVINQIDPQIVIPMYSQNPPAGRAGLESFLKEEGISNEGLTQLKLNLNDLPQEERKVIVLNAN